MNESTTSLTLRQQRLLGQLQRCQESGLNVRAFAEQEGLKVQDLYAGKQELKRKGVLNPEVSVRPGFARVRSEQEGAAGALCRVRLPNGCLVELKCDGSPEAWRALLSAVASLS